MKKFFSAILLGLLLLTGCEHSENNQVEIINSSNYQSITVEVNGHLLTQQGNMYFGPTDTVSVRIRGNDNDPTTIIVKIYTPDGYYLGMEAETYFRREWIETRNIWIIREYFRPRRY